MTRTTPVSRTKTAALARVLDALPKGYTRWTQGTVNPDKAHRLANKFHHNYGVALSPGARLTRKRKGQANTLLVLYWPKDAQEVHWLLLATPGKGMESERWTAADAKPRLLWLGYELVRHAARGRTVWTWRRPKQQMQHAYDLLGDFLRRSRMNAVADFLECLARQPGFHGVREQSQDLFRYARAGGFSGDLPRLYYVQKVKHGEPLKLDDPQAEPVRARDL